MSKRLLIVQPYVPQYRERFFRDLRSALLAIDVELTIAAGQPQGGLAKRGDASTEQVDVPLTEHSSQIGIGKVRRRELGPVLRRLCPDFVVVEQAVKNLEVYSLLMKQTLGGPRVGFWGQGRTFSTKQSWPVSQFKNWTTRRGDWFFAYTEEGRKYVVSHGFPSSRTSVLNNTIDTDSLTDDLASVTREELDEARQRLRLTEGKTALFMGGIDDSKGIDFLLESVASIAQTDPGFTLLMAGDGEKRSQVEFLQSSGWPIRYIGRVDGRNKAMALRLADVLTVPEWVGLVAVDSLVAGVPIVTTNHDSHSPEYFYLQPGRNALVSKHDVNSYSDLIARIINSPEELARIGRKAIEDGRELTLTNMVANFVDGVRKWNINPR